MDLVKCLKKIALFLSKEKNSLFTYPVEEQQKYIYHFSNPKNDIDRSFYQYCCQMKLMGSIISVLINIASLPLLLLFFFKKSDAVLSKHTDAVFVSEGVGSFSIVPQLLKKEYINWEEIIKLKTYFNSEDKKFFFQVLRKHPFSWHFLFKVLLKIRVYSYIIKSYRPKAIVIGAEYSFTSSVMTLYCNMHNTLHIDVMHGEKLYYMRDSFFRFDRTYVWDEYYKNLFVDLRADDKQFIIALPDALVFPKSFVILKTIDYTYYLGGEDGVKPYKEIVKYLNMLLQKGYKVAVRPHPLFSPLDHVLEVFKNIEIENYRDISIYESILRTRNAISLYSTVLNQASINGTGVVIDDLTQKDFFFKLKNLKYIMLDKEHRLLSEVIRDNS